LNHKVRYLILGLIVAAAIWLPRGFVLDHFVTIDESKWLVRSANFYQALTSGNYSHTFQHGHPGVTIMWSGAAGYLWKFPDYIQKVTTQYPWADEFMVLLSSLGHEPIDMLAAGRTFIVLANVLALLVAFFYAVRLFGVVPALVSFGLIAFDPFQAGLSRLLHPDSLLSTFMLAAALAIMGYFYDGRRWRDLAAAALLGALSWLTKTPSIFLVPLFGLLALIEAGQHVLAAPERRWGQLVHPRTLARVAVPLLIWLVAAAALYVLFWPSMWVTPIDTLRAVGDISSDYAFQGHSSPVFFNRHIYNGDPGFIFYPVTYLWRTTPVVLIGLALGLLALIFGRAPLHTAKARLSMVGLLAFAFFFFIFMNLSAKKFDRYFLPAYMPLDMVAGIGWTALAALLGQLPAPAMRRLVAPALLIAVVAAQAALALPTFPYYLSYYNPWMGGGAKAPEVMFIGWGEGLDEAGRYLSAQPDVATAKVSSWYERGPFSFFYQGESVTNRGFWEADYAVIYNHQWQRELPSRRMMSYFNRLTPQHTVPIDGIEYVRIYNMRQAPLPDFTVEWDHAIRLVYYDTFSGVMYPGQKFDMTMYFTKLRPIERNYSIIVRLVNAAGHELLRVEGWPKGMATSQWYMGEILRDNSYEVEIPEDTPPGLYRIEITFYDPKTFDHLQITSSNSGQLINDPYILDYLIVGDLPETPRHPLDPVVDMDGKVHLLGADFLDAEGDVLDAPPQSAEAGDTLHMRLYWESHDFMYADYTGFVHMVGPDGQLAAQDDQRPLDGFIPTSYWSPHQIIADEYVIEIPADAPSGQYDLHSGWYDLATMQRLPMTRDGQPIGDSYVIATVQVDAPIDVAVDGP
jgi:hypothetical protein